MAKLWDKGYAVDKEVEAFTTGDDYLLDRELVEADCVASAAHARMLAKIGILTSDEADKLAAELRAIAADSRSGAFTVRARRRGLPHGYREPPRRPPRRPREEDPHCPLPQ